MRKLNLFLAVVFITSMTSCKIMTPGSRRAAVEVGDQMAIVLDSNNADSFYNLGNVYRGQGEFKKAIGYYYQSLALNAQNTDALINRGFTHENLGNLEAAKADYLQVIAVDSAMAIPHAQLAYIYMQNNDLDQAKTELDRAILLDSEDAFIWNKLGLWHMVNGNAKDQNDGEYHKAIEAYNKAQALNPSIFEIYNNRAVVYLKLKDYDRAWEDVHAVERLGGNPNRVMLKKLKKQSRRSK